MSDISTITILVRYLVEDFLRTSTPGDIYTVASSSVFTLSEPNVVSITSVLKNNVVLNSSNYSFDSSANKLTITSSLLTNDTVEIQYTYYSNFSDAEIESYIRSASVHISLNNYQTWEVDVLDNFYPDLTDAERNLVAIVASILMKPDNTSYKLPDISINVPNSLPTRDLISKAIRIFKSNTTGVFKILDDHINNNYRRYDG